METESKRHSKSRVSEYPLSFFVDTAKMVAASSSLVHEKTSTAFRHLTIFNGRLEQAGCTALVGKYHSHRADYVIGHSDGEYCLVRVKASEVEVFEDAKHALAAFIKEVEKPSDTLKKRMKWRAWLHVASANYVIPGVNAPGFKKSLQQIVDLLTHQAPRVDNRSSQRVSLPLPPLPSIVYPRMQCKVCEDPCPESSVFCFSCERFFCEPCLVLFHTPFELSDHRYHPNGACQWCEQKSQVLHFCSHCVTHNKFPERQHFITCEKCDRFHHSHKTQVQLVQDLSG